MTTNPSKQQSDDSIPGQTAEQPQSAKRNASQSGLRLAILAGLLLWLANPVPAVWPLAWAALAPLVLSVTRAARLRQAIWRGYVFGLAFLGSVWYWIGLTISAWVHSPIGWAGWAGLTVILAGFYGLWGGVAWALCRRCPASGGLQIFALAASWVVVEYLRTRGTLTMPWAQLSYTQYKFLPILQIADVTGAYGVSFVMMLVNGALAFWWTQRGQADRDRWLWPSLTLTLMLCVYGWARLIQNEPGRSLPVAAMQPGFNSLASGFNTTPPPSPEDQYQAFTDLTAQASRSKIKPSLYIWPESAAPEDALHNGHALEFLAYLARDNQAALLTGSTLRDFVTEEHKTEFGLEKTREPVNENASVLFPPQGSPDFYIKRQLVPFGEFIPFRDLIPGAISDTFQFAQRDDVTGKSARVLTYQDANAGRVALGPFICYEAMFPPYAREMTREGASLLVTQSNDSWFQSRAAMQQHLASVVLRAIENRREVARSTTTGITCFVDSRGRVHDALPLNTVGYAIRVVQMRDGLTLYTRLGDWFVLACLLALLAITYKTGVNHTKD